MDAGNIKSRLEALADPEKATRAQRFFKTGPGEYGEGDHFHGIRVPELRRLAREFRDLSLTETIKLLKSPIHEERLLALLILVCQYQKGDEKSRSHIFDAYLCNTRHINKWDLVDLSAEHIIGAYLFNRERDLLDHLARSDSLWERRIAVMATFYFIKKGEFEETLKIARLLLQDKEDLSHKAVGWMLREIVKRELKVEEAFLRQHYRTMPRTMLRYAIERLPETKRQRYLRGKIE